MPLTKVTQQTLLAPTQTASAGFTLGNAISVSAYYAADVRIRMGRNSTVVFGASPPIARLEGTPASTTGTAMDWTVLAQFQAAAGTSLIAGQALSTAAIAGATALQLASAANYAAGQYVFVANATVANVEWTRIASLSGTTVGLEQGVVNGVASGAIVFTQAEQYHALIDVTCLQNVRLVIDNENSSVAVTHDAAFGAVAGL